jgi:DNA-binding transcriptional MerR regulator
LAKATGTKVVTIRYYEHVGLLPPPERSGANYRVYSHGDLRRLQFVRRCRGLGFTVGQVRELLRLSSQENRRCAEVDRITAQHLRQIEQKVEDLTRLADELHRLSKRCKGNGLMANCRIIEALSPDPPPGRER